MAKKASGSNLLVDPEKKKEFIDARDHWIGLNSRANTAVGKRRQYEGDIKKLGFSMRQIKDSVWLSTPEGEAEFKAEIANRLLAAAYTDADIGDQLSLFLDHNRTPAVDRAYKEGQSSAMKNEAAVPKYDPNTEQYRAFMSGYHDEQGRAVKSGIGKLDAKAAKENANGKSKPGKADKKVTAKVSKPAGKRGRPPGPAKAKPADSPPRRPTAQPVTRAALAAQKAAAPADDAASYFSKSEPAGNA